MSGRKSKQKGYRAENALVHLHQAMGIPAERVPLSGAAGGLFSGDLLISCGTKQLKAESKSRKTGSGFKVLEGWLGENDLLFIKRDRQQPMVVMEWDTYAQLIGGTKTEETEGRRDADQG